MLGSCATRLIRAAGVRVRSPPSGSVKPISTRSRVDLPAPLRPTRQARTPGSKPRSTPSNSMRGPSARRTSLRAMIGGRAMGAVYPKKRGATSLGLAPPPSRRFAPRPLPRRLRDGGGAKSLHLLLPRDAGEVALGAERRVSEGASRRLLDRRQHLADGGEDLGDLVLADDQRGREGQGVAGGAQQQAVGEAAEQGGVAASAGR